MNEKWRFDETKDTKLFYTLAMMIATTINPDKDNNVSVNPCDFIWLTRAIIEEVKKSVDTSSKA